MSEELLRVALKADLGVGPSAWNDRDAVNTYESRSGFDTNRSLRALNADWLLAQASRTNRDTDRVFTRLIDARTGAPRAVVESFDATDALKVLGDVRGSRAIVIQNKPSSSREAGRTDVSWRGPVAGLARGPRKEPPVPSARNESVTSAMKR
jgi:hypothetical protein